MIVRDVETGEQREWIVRGEAMPYYTAQIRGEWFSAEVLDSKDV